MFTAEHLGCEVAQIAKSIVLKAENPILVILSGDMRVDLKKLSEVFSSGGSRDSILKIDVNELKNVVKGEIVDVSK